MHSPFSKAGVTPDTYIQDNEISRQMKDCFQQEGVHHITIVLMLLKEQSKPSRITSL